MTSATNLAIKLKYSDSKVSFGRGSFDDWCVFIIKNGTRKAPTDIAYFDFFKQINSAHTDIDVYSDFVRIYERVNKEVEQSTLAVIDDIVIQSGLTGADKKCYEGYLVVIYLAMVAEENKEGTKLGKRIKRLGMHNLLIEDMPSEIAANASRGRRWRELDVEMRQRVF